VIGVEAYRNCEKGRMEEDCLVRTEVWPEPRDGHGRFDLAQLTQP
jgi:hypothetical protein